MINLDELSKKAEIGIAGTGAYIPPTPRELFEIIAEIKRLREEREFFKKEADNWRHIAMQIPMVGK